MRKRSGFAPLWLGDHVIFPSHTASPHPSSGHLDGADIRSNEPVFDPLAVMALARRTDQTGELGLSVLVIPYRNPVVMAKYLASLDVLTGGRIILGTGVGVIEEEFEAARRVVDRSRRGHRRILAG